ncbi:hypothetical protein Btru_066894 [Bulinus truncatus]|nr:hypothetical protein Btru_066894 [Bulinus truncatus]
MMWSFNSNLGNFHLIWDLKTFLLLKLTTFDLQGDTVSIMMHQFFQRHVDIMKNESANENETYPVPSRNIQVISPNNYKMSRNIYTFETASELLESMLPNCQNKNYAVVLCLALNEEVIMSDTSEFIDFFDEIEYIKVVPRWDAQSKPPQEMELKSSFKLKH